MCLWKPDVIAFCAAISACERAAQWTKVLELLKDMRLRQGQLTWPIGAWLNPSVLNHSG